MRTNIYKYILLLFFQISFSQNVNLTIQINDQLIESGLGNLYLTFDNESHAKRFPINYYPGDLILNNEVWSQINLESTDKFYIHFDYYTYKKGGQQIKNFVIQVDEKLLKHPYLIANVYDFRDKKYKHWYQWHTKESYIVEFRHPQCGFLIRAR